MLSFKPKNNDLIEAFVISEVMLEKIRIGGIEIPGLDTKQFRGMSFSFIGETIANHYVDLLADYDQPDPTWMSVIYKENAIPYVSVENSSRALARHDFVLVNTGRGRYPYKEEYELIGKMSLREEHIYLVNYCGDMPGPMLARAINQAHDVVPGFQSFVNGTRTDIASTLVEALEKLNERHYVGVALRNPSEEDKRMMKAARVRFMNHQNEAGESFAIIGYNTLPNPLDKRDLQSIAKYF